MERIKEQDNSRQDNSKKVLAVFLIAIGVLWILKQSGVFYHFPFIHFNYIFTPVGRVFGSLFHIVFSWPVILIIVGMVLMAGKRSAGVVLLILGGIFLLPRLFVFSGAMFLLFLPLILIGVGVAIVARLL